MKRERLLFLYYFAIGLYTAVLFGLGFAIFNVAVGAQMLPVVYVVFPFLDAVTAYVMAKVIIKRGLKTFFHRFIGVLIVLHIILLPVLLQYITSMLAYAVMLILLISVSENLLFTRTYLVQEVFTLDELRRWIPVAISFGAVGALAGGAFLRLSEGILASGLVFLFMFPALIVIGYTSHQLLLTMESGRHEIFSQRMVTAKSIWSYTTGQAFLPLLIMCVAAIAISDTVNEYFFHYYSTSIINDIEKLTGFLGVFLTLRYTAELVLNIFLYNRLVKRIGSINLMPFLLGLSALSLVIISFSPNGLWMALLGRTLSIVAVIGFLMYLLEVFYQLLDPVYRPSLVTIVGYIDAFSGYALGGGLLMVHTMGGLSPQYIVFILVGLLLILAALWTRNKGSFIDVLNASQSAEISGVVEDIIGTGTSGGMLNSLMEQARFGSRSERLFLLYAIKKQPIDKQKEWLSQLFAISEMELRVTILEYIFENQIFDFEPVLHSHELTEAFKNWLVVRCFVHYPQMQSKSLYLSLEELLAETEPSDHATKHMMDYMFLKRKETYNLVLQSIKDRKRLEDDELIDSIIASYYGVEDQAHLDWFASGYISSPKIMAYYDEKLNYMALNHYLENTGYETLRRVVDAYDADTIIRELSTRDKTIVEWVCLAEAERQSKHAYTHYKELLKALYYIRHMEQAVDATHKTAKFLKYELDQVRLSIEAALVDQTFDRGHVSLAGRSHYYLSHEKRRQVLIEMIRGVKRDKWTECLIGLLEMEPEICGLEKKNFVIGDKGNWIDTLAAYNRGESMDETRKKEIDFMIALKSVPMFETLDIDTLKKLTEIVVVSRLSSGDTIVRKGQRGTQFFVLLKGQAAVYLNEKEAPIALIPEGQMIGELGVLNKDTRTATVKADGPVELLSMEGEAFLELVKKNTAISLAVIHTLSERLTDMLKAREKSS